MILFDKCKTGVFARQICEDKALGCRGPRNPGGAPRGASRRGVSRGLLPRLPALSRENRTREDICVRIFPEEKPTTIANPELQTGYYFNFTPVRFCCYIEKRNHIGTNFI